MTRLRQIMVTGQAEFGIIVTMTIFLPLQGLLNLIGNDFVFVYIAGCFACASRDHASVYMVPRFRRYCARHPDEPFFQAMRTVLFKDLTDNPKSSRHSSRHGSAIAEKGLSSRLWKPFHSRNFRHSKHVSGKDVSGLEMNGDDTANGDDTEAMRSASPACLGGSANRDEADDSQQLPEWMTSGD